MDGSDDAQLTALADAVIARAGQPADELFLEAVRRIVLANTEWPLRTPTNADNSQA